MSRSEVGHNNNGEEGGVMHFHCTTGLRHTCVYGSVGGGVGVCWLFFSRQTLLPSGGVQKGGGVSGLDVESKVDSRSSLLEIISFRCTVPNYTHTHIHTHDDTNTHTLTQTDCLSNSKSPRVVTVIAYVIGLNEQNKNKLRYH